MKFRILYAMINLTAKLNSISSIESFSINLIDILVNNNYSDNHINVARNNQCN